MRRINKAGLDLIKHFEQGPGRGPALTAYKCPAGKWTIGYGHTRTARRGMTIDETTADALLGQDLFSFENAVASSVNVDLSDNQFAALVSFVFNVGTENFRSSTLLRKLNDGDYNAVPDELLRWTRARGIILSGLIRRRKAEGDLWRTGDGNQA